MFQLLVSLYAIPCTYPTLNGANRLSFLVVLQASFTTTWLAFRFLLTHCASGVGKNTIKKKTLRDIHSAKTGKQGPVTRNEEAPRHVPWVLHWDQRQSEHTKCLHASLLLMLSSVQALFFQLELGEKSVRSLLFWILPHPPKILEIPSLIQTGNVTLQSDQ